MMLTPDMVWKLPVGARLWVIVKKADGTVGDSVGATVTELVENHQYISYDRPLHVNDGELVEYHDNGGDDDGATV